MKLCVINPVLKKVTNNTRVKSMYRILHYTVPVLSVLFLKSDVGRISVTVHAVFRF
jgi:hypothetical protein